MERLKQLAETLANLTVLEANKLGEILKEDHGIEPTQNTIVYQEEVVEEVEQEQTEFDVILKSIGKASKLHTVKLVKDLTSLGLRDAKDLVDSAPVKVKEGVSKSEAEELEKQFDEIGAETEIK